MQRLYLLTLFLLFLLASCGGNYTEIKPVSNQDSIKIKLEVQKEKTKPDKKDSFVLRLTNTGERDLGRCNIIFDGKYVHQLEGLINKTDDVSKLNTSMLKGNDVITIFFNDDIDNYTIFGIMDNNFKIPGTIELTCLDGKVVWKL